MCVFSFFAPSTLSFAWWLVPNLMCSLHLLLVLFKAQDTKWTLHSFTRKMGGPSWRECSPTISTCAFPKIHCWPNLPTARATTLAINTPQCQHEMPTPPSSRPNLTEHMCCVYVCVCTLACVCVCESKQTGIKMCFVRRPAQRWRSLGLHSPPVVGSFQ